MTWTPHRLDPMARFSDIPKFTHPGRYSVDVSWPGLEAWLRQDPTTPVDMDPDFQRGHVWNQEQQRRYVEYVLRGGQSGRTVYWNHPAFESRKSAHSDLDDRLLLVDGKQRIAAVIAFLHDEIAPFGARYSEFDNEADRRVMANRCTFRMNVNELQTRAEVLQWYLDINDGGVVHSPEEIARVRQLLAETQRPWVREGPSPG